MAENTIHPDNDTPTASDEGVKRMDKDTPFHPVPGAPLPTQK
jgi:hypothetical protein